MLKKLIVNTALLSIAILGCSCSASLAETPTNSRQQKLMTDADLVNNLRRVPQELSQTISNGGGNTPLAIPLGTNSPISIGRMPDEGQLQDSNFEAIGYVGIDGQPKPITPIVISNMATTSLSNIGTLININKIYFPQTNKIELVNNHTELAQSRRRIHTIDLIVRNRRDNIFYLVPRVNANAFFRDAVNAVLNRTLRRVNPPLEIPTRILPIF